MANVFDQFDNPYDQFDGSILSDVAKSAKAGVERGVLGMQGAVGDVDRQLRKGAFAIAELLGFGRGRTVADRLGLADTTNAAPPESLLPSTGQLTNVYESAFGPIHQPQTTLGEYGRTLGEFAPAAFGGPATRLGKVASVAVPALLSETAGQAARRVAPEYEPHARLAGGLAGSLSAIKTRSAPKTEEWESLKAAAYQQFDASGSLVSAPAFRRMIGDIVTDAKDAGIDRGLHKQAIASVRRLAEEFGVDKPRSLQEVERLRRLINGAGRVPNISDDERRIITGMVDKLDDFVEGLPNNRQALLTGNPSLALKTLQQARELNRKFRRSEMVDLMEESARLRGGQAHISGRENALRTEFRQLGLRLAKNKNLRRLFTKAERTAIAKVANPGPAENALRTIGRLAPSRYLSLGTGGALIGTDPGGVGTLAAGGLWGAGTLAELMASALTNKNLGNARNALLGVPPQMVPYAPYVNPLGASAATLPLRGAQ